MGYKDGVISRRILEGDQVREKCKFGLGNFGEEFVFYMQWE